MYYSNLTLIQYTKEISAQTCANYYYQIQTNAMNLRAFRTAEALQEWLDNYGLELTEPLKEKGIFSYQAIKGEYSEQYCSIETIQKLIGGDSVVRVFRALSNGDYVTACTIQNPLGGAIVHLPYAGTCHEFDLDESRRLEDKGQLTVMVNC